MSRSDDKRLGDIRRMCTSVEQIVARGRDAVDDDPALWLALERALEIAGEAATRLNEQTRSRWPDMPWQGLIGLRVVLAHAYHRTDPDQLWEIAVRDMPRVADALGRPS